MIKTTVQSVKNTSDQIRFLPRGVRGLKCQTSDRDGGGEAGKLSAPFNNRPLCTLTWPATIKISKQFCTRREVAESLYI